MNEIKIDGACDFGNKHVTKVSLQKNFFHVWLTDEIDTPEHYIDVFNCLMSAEENDIVAFHINSPGGNLNTTLQIIDAIESTPATTVAFIEGEACSGASMISMVCQNVNLSKYSYMMIHTFSQATGGKFSDILKSTNFNNKWWEKTFSSIYKGFCTEEEIRDILNGKDLWLDAEECIKRFKHREELLNQEKNKTKKAKKKQKSKENGK